MSYSEQKLRFFVDDSDGWLRRNQAACEKFALAEDDGELREFFTLVTSTVLFSSFWGLARGPHAAVAVREEEKSSLRLTWTTGVIPLTSHTFYREGYMYRLGRGGVGSIPIVGPFASALLQKKIIESFVVREGKVVFRDLGYKWGLAVY